ncbi:MAG: hypothetical protein ACXW0Z_01355 [Gemmatirosa sp.]
MPSLRSARVGTAVLLLLLGTACRSARPAGPGAEPTPTDSGAAARPDSAANGPRALPDPSTAVRFEIVTAGDSTFQLLATEQRWLRAGMSGIVVDPRRRDVLVARFTLLAQRADTGDAVVTGQTMRVSTDHVALVARPPEPPRVIHRIERRRFWTGAAIGGALGLIVGILID